MAFYNFIWTIPSTYVDCSYSEKFLTKIWNETAFFEFYCEFPFEFQLWPNRWPAKLGTHCRGYSGPVTAPLDVDGVFVSWGQFENRNFLPLKWLTPPTKRTTQKSWICSMCTLKKSIKDHQMDAFRLNCQPPQCMSVFDLL